MRFLKASLTIAVFCAVKRFAIYINWFETILSRLLPQNSLSYRPRLFALLIFAPAPLNSNSKKFWVRVPSHFQPCSLFPLLFFCAGAFERIRMRRLVTCTLLAFNFLCCFHKTHSWSISLTHSITHPQRKKKKKKRRWWSCMMIESRSRSRSTSLL
jgi:hypothetical protein